MSACTPYEGEAKGHKPYTTGFPRVVPIVTTIVVYSAAHLAENPALPQSDDSIRYYRQHDVYKTQLQRRLSNPRHTFPRQREPGSGVVRSVDPLHGGCRRGWRHDPRRARGSQPYAGSRE